MSRRLSAATLTCSVLLLACQPQSASQPDDEATPAVATHPDAFAPASPPDTPADTVADATTGAVGNATQVLRITTQRGSVDCTDRHVEVLAAQAELAFTGQCLELYFLGAHTRASIQAAEMVQVVADNVALDVASPLTELRQLGNTGQHHLDAVTGEVYVPGDGNQIRARSVGALTLIGSRNRVHWQTGQPVTSDLGSGNIVGLDE